MKREIFDQYINKIIDNVLSNFRTIPSLFQVVGNNQRYDFINQLSIWNKRPNATACADFNTWSSRYSRKIKPGSKGIPHLTTKGKRPKVVHIFDILQTEETYDRSKKLSRWEYDAEKDDAVFQQILQEKGQVWQGDRLDAVERVLDFNKELITSKVNQFFSENQRIYELYVRETTRYAIACRLKLPVQVNWKNLIPCHCSLDKEGFLFLGNLVSGISKNIIEEIKERSEKKLQEVSVVLNEKGDFNEQRDNEQHNSGTATYSRVLQENEGRVQIQNESDRMERVAWRYVSRSGRQIWRLCRYDGNSRENARIDTGSIIRGTEGIHEGISKTILRRTTAGVFSDQRARRGLGLIEPIIFQRSINSAFNGNAKRSSRLFQGEEGKHDGEFQIDRGIEGDKSGRIRRSYEQFEILHSGDDNSDIHFHLTSDKKEAENASFLISKNRNNYRISEELFPDKLLPSERLNYNLEAISMLNRLESGERTLDISAQTVLARYVGWGGLSEVFDEEKGGQWKEAREFLNNQLSKSEYENARESTLTSFYTPKEVIAQMYQTLFEMGFEKGNILEPSVGIGNFLGNLPENMRESKVYGVEIDSVSGRIAKQLYPESKIEIKGFEETNFSNNFFDIAIGNVPFGEFKVYDRDYDKHHFLIHDYFFAKALDKVRPGGIIAFITSTGTMDKKDNHVRRYLSARAELIGAVRLPNATFKGIAGTEVTSDILFLKKRTSIMEREEDWIFLGKDEEGLEYNRYFISHPEMVLGKMQMVSGRFGQALVCVPQPEKPFSIVLSNAMKLIAENGIYESMEVEEDTIKTIPATEDVKNFSYTMIDGEVYYREDSLLLKKSFSEKKKNIIKGYLSVYEALKELIYRQKEDYTEEKIKESQNVLNERYDDFFKSYHHFNHKDNVKILKEDSNFPLVSSLEVMEEEEFERKADIFTKRTIKKAIPVLKVDTAQEALILSVSEKGKIDFDYMKSLTNKSKMQLIQELKGEIFLDIPVNAVLTLPKQLEESSDYLPFASSRKDITPFSYVTKDEYLSGNIRKKIKNIDNILQTLKMHQESNLKDHQDYQALLIGKEVEEISYQREELENVLPKTLEASEIKVKLGATWIPEKIVEAFVYETLKTPRYARFDIHIRYSKQTSDWNVEGKSRDSGNPLAELTYGTSRVNAYKIIEDALNLKETKVFDQIINSDGTMSSVLNKRETILVGQKMDLLKNKFESWIFENPNRRKEMVELYNEKFNSIRNREYDGSNLFFAGMNPSIHLRPHQKNAIARILYGGNTLLAHVVGSGKTFEMVASAMESKRLGMSNKALFVVPNHLIVQTAREFIQLYPSANIMVADKKDFEPKRRKRFIARIATGEYDAVIIGHTQFEKIPMSKEYQERHIQEQIDDIVSSLKDMKGNQSKRFSIKQLEKTKKRLEAKLIKMNDDFRKDDVITFEELGVDKLFVDEAHNYKNLFLHTKMTNVAGIGQTKAQKSSDLFMKCRYMDELTGGKGIVFATGTPISNSMTELYTMQRYLQYEELKQYDLEHFDSWASTFGDTTTSFEVSPEGTGYRMKTRFSKFYGLPELMSMFKEVADIQTADMLNLPTPEAHYEVIKTLPSEEQKEILKGLSERADKVRNKAVEPDEDNMLKITYDGKKLALDQRLINPLLPDNPDSKVNVCVKNVFSIWDKTKENKSTQLLFSDMSTPKGDGEFNIYDDIREKLVAMGVPKEEIAFIHEAKTDQEKNTLFLKMRKGKIRVLLGSTSKLGAGTNVQNKLIALHDLDVPWRPSDLEQRSGRIVRQGNENKEVKIYRYITENTFDSYLWQTIENKQKFISQIMTSKTPIRTMEDVDEMTLNYAEIKALATNNSLIKEKMILDNEVTRLKMLEADYKSNRFRLEDLILNQYPHQIQEVKSWIEAIDNDILNIAPKMNDDNYQIILIGKEINDKKLAKEMLSQIISQYHMMSQEQKIGTYRNLDLWIGYDIAKNEHTFRLSGKANHYGVFSESTEGNLQRLDNVIDRIKDRRIRLEEKLKNLMEQKLNAEAEVEKPFSQSEELMHKILRLSELNKILELGENELKEVKQAVIDFCNREYDGNLLLEDFDKEYPDLNHVEIAYSTTPDKQHEIQYEFNFVDGIATQYVDQIVILQRDFYKECGNIDLALKKMAEFIKKSSFLELISTDEKTLEEKLDDFSNRNFYFAKENRLQYEIER